MSAKVKIFFMILLVTVTGLLFLPHIALAATEMECEVELSKVAVASAEEYQAQKERLPQHAEHINKYIEAANRGYDYVFEAWIWAEPEGKAFNSITLTTPTGKNFNFVPGDGEWETQEFVYYDINELQRDFSSGTYSLRVRWTDGSTDTFNYTLENYTENYFPEFTPLTVDASSQPATLTWYTVPDVREYEFWLWADWSTSNIYETNPGPHRIDINFDFEPEIYLLSVQAEGEDYPHEDENELRFEFSSLNTIAINLASGEDDDNNGGGSSGEEGLPADISMDFAYIQYQNYSPESGQDRYAGWFEFSQDGHPLTSDCIEQISLLDSNGDALEIGVRSWEDAYLFGRWNESNNRVEYDDGLYHYMGYEITFPRDTYLPQGNYTFNATTSEGENISYPLYFPGEVHLPTVSKETINHLWNQDGSLNLSWTIPDGDFEEFMFWFMDGDNYEDLLFVEQPNSSRSLTIPADIVSRLKDMTSSTSLYLRLETRAYSYAGMNYARGITYYRIPMDSESTGSSGSSIVGAWDAFSDTNEYGCAVFYENGQYLVYDSSEVEGVEYGTYTHDNSTGELTLNVVKDENGAAGLADNGVPMGDTIYVDEDTLMFIEYDGERYSHPRLCSANSPIVGAWDHFPNEFGACVFYENGKYVVYDSSEVEGVEYGTYTHDNSTGAFSVSVVKDENWDAGFAEDGVPFGDDHVVIENDKMYVNDNPGAPRVGACDSNGSGGDSDDDGGGSGGGCFVGILK